MHDYVAPKKPDSLGLEPCEVCGFDRYSHPPGRMP